MKMTEETNRVQEALRQVDAAADEAWKALARQTVLDLSLTKAEFTADDVWLTGLAEPREPRALGAVIVGLANEGYIEQTGRFVKTIRKPRGGSPIIVWRRKVAG